MKEQKTTLNYSGTPFYRNIAANSLYLFAGISLANGTRFFTNVLLARKLGAEIYGIIALLLGIVCLVTNVCDLGLSTALTKRIAQELGSENKNSVLIIIQSFQSTILLFGIVGAIFCGSLVSSFRFSALIGEHISDIWLLGFWVLVPTVANSFTSVFNGFEDMKFTLFYFFMLEPLKLVTVLLLIVFGSLSLLSLLWYWTIAHAVTLIGVIVVGQFFLIKRIKTTVKKFWAWKNIIDCLRESIMYFLPFIGNTIMPGMVASALGLVSTKKQIAWFSASVSLASINFLMLAPVAYAMLPAFTYRYAASDNVITPHEGNHFFCALSFFSICVLLLFVSLGPLIIHYTFGEKFYPAVAVLIIMAAANFFETYRLGVDPLLNSIDMASTVSRIELLRYFIMVPAVVGLGWRYGALGAAIGVLSSSAVCCISRLYVMQQRLGITGVWFALRLILWCFFVLLSWHLNISLWYVLPGAILLGRGLGLYRLTDLKSVFLFTLTWFR